MPISFLEFPCIACTYTLNKLGFIIVIIQLKLDSEMLARRLRHAQDSIHDACRLEDISDTPDLKTNERLHEAKRLLYVALEQ